MNLNVKLILSNRNAIAYFFDDSDTANGKKMEKIHSCNQFLPLLRSYQKVAYCGRENVCLSVRCYLRYLEWVDWVNMNANMSIIFRFS